MCLGNRELHTLVLSDRATEHDPVFHIGRDAVDEPAAVADALGRDQRALCIQSVQDVLEALPFLADQVLGRNLQVLEEQFVGLVIHHVQDGPHFHALADRIAQVDDEDRHTLALLLHIGQWRGARQQNHQVGMLDAGDPHLLAVDHIAVALADCHSLDLCRVGAGAGFGHAHALQTQLTCRDLRQVALLLLGRTVAQQRAHVVHLAMACAGISATAVDLFHDHGCLGQSETRSAVFLRYQRGHPAGFGESVDKNFGIGSRLIDLAVVFIRKFSAE